MGLLRLGSGRGRLGVGLGCALLAACAPYGEIDGQLAEHKFGGVRSAYFDIDEADDLSLTVVVLSDHPYSCEDLQAALAGQVVETDDGREVGQVVLYGLSRDAASPAAGLLPVVTGVDDVASGASAAMAVVQVLDGTDYSATAWVLASEGQVELTSARGGLEGAFDVETSGGPFVGSFAASACDLPEI